MGIQRLKHRIDRWRKKPRFRPPASALFPAALLGGLLLALALGPGAPEAPPASPPRWSAPPSRPPEPAPDPAPTEAPPPQAPAGLAESACPEGCETPPPGCTVKGNISTKSGEKIYHLPGQSFYDQTVITPSHGEAWFCTEAEARANGWRKSKR